VNCLTINTETILGRIYILWLLTLTMVLVSFTTFGHSIQSLEKSLSKASKAQDSLHILFQICTLAADENIELGKYYAEKAHKIAGASKNKSDIVKALLLLGQFNRLTSDFEKSIRYSHEALQTIDKNDSALLGQGLHEIGMAFQLKGQQDSAIYYFKKAIAISEQIGDTLNTAFIRSYLGESHNRLGNLKIALELCHQALKEIQPFKAKKKEAIVLNFLGATHVSLGQFPSAIEHFISALAIADSLGNMRVRMEQLNDMGVVYAVQGDNLKSLEYFGKALKVAGQIKSHRDYIGSLSNIAYIYSLLGETSKALEFYQRVTDYNQQYGSRCMLPYINEGIARLYESFQKTDSAYSYYKSTLTLAEECQMTDFKISALQGMGRYYLSNGNIEKAILQFKKSYDIANESNLTPLSHIAAKELYNAYKSIGDYEKSLMYHEVANALQDSLYSEESTQEVLNLTARYEFDKQKQLLKAQQEHNELKHQEELKRQIMARNYMWLGIILMVILAVSIWYLYLNKKRANAQLTKLNNEKNELIGIVAHDLKSPLNVMSGMLPMLKSDLEHAMTEEQQIFCQMINDNVDRMNEMITRILDVNAIESESINAQLESHDLAAILNTVINNFEIMSAQKGIAIIKHFEFNKYYSYVDRNYMIQILENLISNALKFSPSATMIDISIFERNYKINIAIKDQGPGISKEDQQQLFNRFAKLSAKPTGSESSTGLGLSIVKKYINAMNGDVLVDSKLGVGTTFTIQLNTISHSPENNKNLHFACT